MIRVVFASEGREFDTRMDNVPAQNDLVTIEMPYDQHPRTYRVHHCHWYVDAVQSVRVILVDP